MFGSTTLDRLRFAGALTLAGLLVVSLPTIHASAQEAEPPAAASASTEGAAAAEAPLDEVFTAEELRKLLAPFALYPDALLAQLLPACAYPIDIVQAARWLDKNKTAVTKGDFSGADTQPWDPSVRALVRFPDIIKILNDDLDMTTDLGDAFVNQPDDVAAMIQKLRAEAEKGGSLKSTKQQRVVVQQQNDTSYIVIEPTDPEVIYVPSYNPATVYYEDNYDGDFVAGAIGFGVGVVVGAAIDNVWDWNRGWVYPPRWPGYPGYGPGYPGYGPGRNGNVNIGNDINVGGNNNVNIGNGNTRPWKPDQDRYRPGQGSKPGLADRPNRPGAGNRPGGADRPGVADRPGGANRPEIGNRPGVGDRPGRPDGIVGGGQGRPNLGNGDGPRGNAGNRAGVDRPAARPAAGGGAKGRDVANREGANREGVKKQVAAKKPAAAKRPVAKKAPKPTAFGDVRSGGGSKSYGQRGAASRQNFQRPSGGGRPQMNRGGGGRPAMHGGGGGRGGGHGGGGRRR